MSMIMRWPSLFSATGADESQDQILSKFHDQVKRDIEQANASVGVKSMYYRLLADRYWRAFCKTIRAWFRSRGIFKKVGRDAGLAD